MTRQRTAPFASIDEIAWGRNPGDRYPRLAWFGMLATLQFSKTPPNAGADPVRARDVRSYAL
jgi:hypothetical protein